MGNIFFPFMKSTSEVMARNSPRNTRRSARICKGVIGLESKKFRIPFDYRCIPEKGDIESEREIGAEGDFSVAVAGNDEDDDSYDASGKVSEEESERRDFRSGNKPHEEGDTEISSAHPFPSRDEDLDVEEGEYPECTEQCVDEWDIEDRIMEREEVSEYRDIDSERYDEKKGEEYEIRRNEDFIGDFHEEDIIENEYDRHEGDTDKESELHHFRK